MEQRDWVADLVPASFPTKGEATRWESGGDWKAHGSQREAGVGARCPSALLQRGGHKAAAPLAATQKGSAPP